TMPVAEALVAKMLTITDLVLSNHVDPPTRQEMILEGVKSLFQTAKIAQPLGLSRRVSSLATPEQFQTFLHELLVQANQSQVPSDRLEKAMLDGILHTVPGEPDFIPAKELKISEQLAANRYIGIGIALGNMEEEGPRVMNVFR